ncbi:MAG: zinc-finger domain-containing protein [Alphaproteobacteria bacterium]|nr:zinc-finger domain-containing protein [Alphaproteobacteria bacterium]
MAQSSKPHFHNTMGLSAIEVGASEFMCVGDLPPFDHPHVFLDMGSAGEIVCPYCSTLYRLNRKLASDQAKPAEAIWRDTAA